MIEFNIKNLKIALNEKDKSTFLVYSEQEPESSECIYPLGMYFDNRTLTFTLYFKNKKWKLDRTRIIIWPFYHPYIKSEAHLIIKKTKKYFNENYPSYDELILYEKIKEI